MNLRILLLSIIASVCISIGLPNTAYSQKKAKKSQLLPDINPQDIEIRGKFHARFPGLNRQPILGFNPNAQIFQIDPNRRPFMESGNQRVANLSVSSLTRPQPPAFVGLNYAKEISTYAKLGFGSYTSPQARYWGAYRLNKKSYVGGTFNLSSSDDHLDDQPSSFRFLTGHAEFVTKLNKKLKLNLHAGLQNDFNYAAEFNNASRDARIEYQGYNGGFKLSHFTNDVTGFKLQGNVRSFNTDFKDTQFGGNIDEVTYNGSFLKRWALGKPNRSIGIKAGVRGGTYSPENIDRNQFSTLEGGVVYDGLFAYQTKFHIEADVFYASDIKDNKVYPGGLLQIDHWFGDRLKITGKVHGKPYVHSVEQLHEQNRFLGFNNLLQHTYSVDFTGEASIKYYRGSKLHFGATYTNAQDYAFFTPNFIGFPTFTEGPQPRAALDTYRVNYQDATNFKLFAGITHQLVPQRFWLSAKAYVQNPELDSGEKIPFEESWGAKGSVSYRPVDLLTLKGWTRYVPKRNTTLAGNEKLDGFLLVGGQADITFVDNIGAYVKLENILNQKYQLWKGYQQRPFQIYGGLNIKF